MLSQSDRSALTGVRILVVDDDEDIRDVTASLLSACGAEVDSVDCSESARECLHVRRYDVLVSDISMPGEDGFALMRWLRASGGINAAIRAAAVTARVSERDLAEARASGFDTFVAKPFAVETLFAEVRALTSSRHRQRRRAAL